MGRKVYITVFLISILISSIPAFSARDENKITLAVMDFKNNSSRLRYDRLQHNIPILLCWNVKKLMKSFLNTR